MPIIVSCPSCSGQLRVSDDLIGRMVRCPACQTTFESKAPPPVSTPPQVAEPPVETVPVPVWRNLNLELSDEKPTSPESDVPPLEQMPLKGAVELDAGGDAPARSSVPAEESEEKPAEPEEDKPRPKAKLSDDHDDLQPCPACGKMIHRHARRCYSCGERFASSGQSKFRLSEPDEEDDDYAHHRRRRTRRDTEPHRGALVLTFGILSVAGLFVCWPLAPFAFGFGIAAWWMGHGDLRRIRDGTMDPDGEETTRAGWICGIIGTFLNLMAMLACAGIFGFIWYDEMQRTRRFQRQQTPIPRGCAPAVLSTLLSGMPSVAFRRLCWRRAGKRIERNSFGLAALARYAEIMSAAAKPPVTRLSDLAPGQSGDFFALLSERKLRHTSVGKPYYHCRFRDARRTVTLMVWSEDKWFAACESEWQVNECYKLRAVYEEDDRFGPQVQVQNIRPVRDSDSEDGFDPSHFIESSKHDLNHLFDELHLLTTKHIADEPLRGLVLALLDAHAAAWLRLPATRDRAYPYRGGLLEHTLSVAQIAIDLAERYARAWPNLHPPLNKDLVTAGAVLHDIGRVLEMGEELPLPSFTVEGRLAGHLLLGRDLVRTAATDRGVNPELVQLLEHILITPLFPSETGGPRWPLIPEGLIVGYAADLDQKMAMYVRCLERDASPGPFTERDPALGRQLLKGRGV